MIRTWLFALLGLISVNMLSQVTANPPDPIILCDVNNPGDETEIFDLTIREAQIINGQTNVVVTFHETSGDALSGTNAFSNPTAYQNIYNPQIVFVRLQSTAGQGWDVTTLELIVPLIPIVAQDPDDIFIDEGDGDGVAIFDLTVNELQVLGSQDPFLFQFSYFQTFQDAINNVNPILDPMAYVNITNPQTIFGRIAPNQDVCEFEVFDFEISTDGLLAISEVVFKDFKIYPNPASNELSVYSQYLNSVHLVTIFNLQGQVVFVANLKAMNQKITVDISDLASGVYILQLDSEEKTARKKLIKI